MTLLRKFQLLPTSRLSFVIAIFYAIIAYGSLQLSFTGTNASPVWPPSGIAFTAVWFLGYRVWPGIWLGAFIANVVVFIHNGWTDIPAAPVSALIATGNTLEALFGVYLLRCFAEDTIFLSKIRDIFKFVFAVLIACLTSATIGTSAVYFIHPAAGVSFDMVWFTWWLGDVIGILVIASIFLTFHRQSWRISSVQNALEAILVCLVLILVNAGIFMGKFPEYGFYSHVTYLALPFAIWAAYRFGFPGATVSILTTSIISIVGSIYHLGPFVGHRAPEELVIVECFIGVIVITVLTLAAALYERQKAEEDIKYKEARFRSLVENSFEVVAMVDIESKVLYTSPPTKNVLGYDHSELIGHSMFEWMHPEDVPGVLEIFQGLLKNPGVTINATCRMRRKDGTWRWMEGSGCNLLHQPAVAAVVVNYRDITERKKAQLAIEESELRFRTMADTAPVMIWMSGPDGHYSFFNKAWITFIGNVADDEFKNGWRQRIHPEDFSRCTQIYSKAFADREKFTLDYRLKREDGVYRWVLDTGVPRVSSDGYFGGFIGSCIDITDRKSAEEVLKRDKDSLVQMIDERSKELIKTQKELKQFSRLADIGTLAATVAHELRNPLGVIHLAAYNLRKEKSDLNANKHLVNIEKKVWEGNQIIDNLLSYARIKIPNYENVRILNILDECVASAQGRFEEKGVIIEKKYGEGLDFIEADPNQIRDVFLNILNNACQSFITPGGKIELKIVRDGDMVKVSVQDTGVGIAPEDLDKVFEPFFTRKSKGTGLGLTICNELVNLHQGKIEINSRQGQGTTVTISLPVHRSDHAEIAHH